MGTACEGKGKSSDKKTVLRDRDLLVYKFAMLPRYHPLPTAHTRLADADTLGIRGKQRVCITSEANKGAE